MSKQKLRMAWGIGAVAIGAVALAAYSVGWPAEQAPEVIKEDCTTHPQVHEPIKLRSGIVVQAGAGRVSLRVEPEAGEPFDTLNVTVASDTPVVEIRIPSFMTKELRDRLENGGAVIRREAVPFENVRDGMEVDVISDEDTYCSPDIAASRLEYEVIIDTEQQE